MSIPGFCSKKPAEDLTGNNLMKIDAKLNIIEEVHSIVTQKLSNAIEMIYHLNLSNIKSTYF
jgi:hypothetical protein